MFGLALVGSAGINGYQCYQQGLPGSCVIPGVISLAAGAYGGLFGSRLAALGGLVFSNLFDLNFGRGGFSVELAAGRC
jgi:hypothetical protein